MVTLEKRGAEKVVTLVFGGATVLETFLDFSGVFSVPWCERW